MTVVVPVDACQVTLCMSYLFTCRDYHFVTVFIFVLNSLYPGLNSTKGVVGHIVQHPLAASWMQMNRVHHLAAYANRN